jgi:hypothetical protein
VAAAGALVTGGHAALSAPITAFAPTGSYFDNGEGNDGLFFTPKVAITVKSLGYLDCGFVTSHPVALFDATSQQILAMVTITAGSGGSAVAGFRYESLSTPVTLTAGKQYALVGLNPFVPNNTDIGIESTQVNPDQNLIFDGYRYNYDSTLTFPTISYPSAIAMTNMQYDLGGVSVSSVIPEPMTGMSIPTLYAGLGMGGRGRGRRVGGEREREETGSVRRLGCQA